MQGSYLLIYLGQFFAVALDKGGCPLLYHGEMTQDGHTRHGNTTLVATQEEPDGQQCHCSDDGQQDIGKRRHLLRDNIKRYAKQPEPEVAVDVRHHIQYD